MDRSTVLLEGVGTGGAFSRIILILLVITTFPLQAQTFNCDTSLEPEAGSIGYGPRSEGTRCEGMYVSQVGGGLQIVSLNRGISSLRPEYEIVKVAAPDLKNFPSSKIHVRAVPFYPNTYYRMDAVITRDHPLTWPLNDIVKKIGLDPGYIGIYGWLEKNDDIIFLPLLVTPEGALGIEANANHALTLVIRSADKLEKLAWRSSIDNSDQVSEWHKYAAGEIRAGQPVPIILPAGSDAVLSLEIAAKLYGNDEWRILELRVQRVGE